MRKNLWNAFALALAIMLLGAGLILLLKTQQTLGAPGVKVVAVPLRDDIGNPVTAQSVPLPEEVPGFSSRPLPISATELKTLPRDTTYGRRYYEGPAGFGAQASVILMGADRTSIHKPEFCLPGQGWTIDRQEVIQLQVARPAPYPLPVMKWTISQRFKNRNGGNSEIHALYLFWFVAENEMTPFHRGRVLSMVKRLLTKGELQRWAYVSYFAPCRPGQEEVTLERLKALIAASVPEFQLAGG